MTRTRVRCGWLVSMDDAIGDQQNIDLVIADDRIEAIGRDLTMAVDEEIDASSMIVMPGLINMHLHTFQAGFRGVGSEWLSADYFRILYGDIATRFTPEDNYLGTLFGALGQLDAGVTTLLDYSHNLRSLEQAERSVDALVDAGLRAMYIHGDGLREPAKPGALPARRLHPADRVKALQASRFAHAGRVTLGLGIAGPHWADWEASLHNVRLARDLGLLASSHVTKSRANAIVPDGYDRLLAMGLLGPDHNLVHCHHLSADEIGRLLDAGCSITCTNMNELHDYPNMTAMLRVIAHGATPSIGVDVEAMVTGSLWREMQMALLFARNGGLLQKSATPMIRSREALRWATTAGAKALMMERDIGALRPGMKADLIMLDAGELNLFPVHDPVFAAVEQSHPGNVDTVIVDGIVRKRHGRLLFDAGKRKALGEKLIDSVTRLSAESGYALPGV
ncbi:amidohydrolase family protein [Bradyrhizobium sp. U87765 SZCCT0131]|uniref:amidohydrolase family protein n=1 Tax=unclassified Bradyrhizobium TaxID=2631580 RepID=UPI001BA87D07|nr:MULTISPECIES: amidohydrolase family protein [unclassified Bradyrhizobium]MBR1222493.1 amidohydrolase family protein [Bradyrhizobium sp. U87765 SZCCT0131]MBR1265426.1 amidohydrolase family protein [Bradyrhizobium sp. U87765 SZCCT0134]MBR1302795.1 amidohydrolase family protein [Bradyrhizobium sp. U87765 SZCCT0110]MBR1323493.1 amidohydrolase family protein [Bradyrhizobium sp. U87765 SZCCT0109]MBR1346724.1 amidohydrolase family protein [Bradyrhizobium sp. U87765 SZCCT0048]